MNADQGTAFGTWPDEVSRWLYHDSVPLWIEALDVDTQALTVDLGGANALLRPWFPQLITVDSDPTKQPDVTADVTRWQPGTEFPQAVLRYVLHYLPDHTVATLLQTVATYTDHLYVVQFTNPDVHVKDRNSRYEPQRWWRSDQDLDRLLAHPSWEDTQTTSWRYRVTEQFYRNRLGPGDYEPHVEDLTVHHLTRRTS